MWDFSDCCSRRLEILYSCLTELLTYSEDKIRSSVYFCYLQNSGSLNINVEVACLQFSLFILLLLVNFRKLLAPVGCK